MRRAVILITGFALLALVNLSIYKREALLARGRIVLLELAPVDPRSLMQGDYMALRFRVGSELETRRRENLSDGNLILAVGAKGIAAYRRIDDGTPLAADELRMRFRVREGNVKFATNAFFFEEGTGEAYTMARYGEFRVDDKGDAILTHLCDVAAQRISPR
ncbi:MAG: GDYXXLXY domain-containing protein [Turneriella sp.]|nr:GDYXXLXY domain-containing protein [Turneriella sp.]